MLKEAVNGGAGLKQLAYVDSRSADAELIRSMFGEAIPSHEISRGIMDWVSDVVTSQGILGVVEQVDIPYGEFITGEHTLLLVADQVRDPGNLGALMRIADASGADGFLMTTGCVDVYNSKVVRSGAGSHFHVSCVRDVRMEELRVALAERGFSMLGLDPRGERCYLEMDLTAPCALVVGNEAFGIAEEDRALLDETVHIEMPGKAESINVASAAAVVLFEALRQRGTPLS